jgi:DNA-binding transcriptional regulator YdaS (Cro superfamily)
MKKQDAISHFGSQVAVARAAGISRQAVSQWGDFVPPTVAKLLAEISVGGLVYDPDVYPSSYRRPGGRLWVPKSSIEISA